MTLRRLSGEIHDPRDGEWMFDSSSLINLRIAGLLDTIMREFHGRAHLIEEVLVELDKGTTGPIVRSSSWFEEVAPDAATHLREVARLRQRWRSAPGRDKGEAASIVVARRRGWRLICEDGVGYAAARTAEQVCVMRTVDLMVAMVRCGWAGAAEVWAGYETLRDARQKLGVVPWEDTKVRQPRVKFDQLCSPRLRFDECLYDGASS